MNEMYLPPHISITKSAANGQVYDVVDYDEYSKNYQMYAGRSDVAVKTNYQGQELILPIKGQYNGNPISPGLYNAGPIDFFNYPDEISLEKYIPTNTVTMDNSQAIGDIIRSEEMAKRLDEPFITTPDNITSFPIKEGDQPEMVCLKTALNSKHIDLDKYAGRFGDNFPNDKRQLKSKSATLNIIKRYSQNCDMEAILILRDKPGDIPNPMGREIRVSLTEPIDMENIFGPLNNEMVDEEDDED